MKYKVGDYLEIIDMDGFQSEIGKRLFVIVENIIYKRYGYKMYICKHLNISNVYRQDFCFYEPSKEKVKLVTKDEVMIGLL